MKKRRKTRKPAARYKNAIVVAFCSLVILAFIWPILYSGLLKLLIPVGRPTFGTLENGTRGDAIFSGEEIVLRAPVSGSIKFLVKDGDSVRVGDVIAEISQEGVLQGAEENLLQAKNTLKQYDEEKGALISSLSSQLDENYRSYVNAVSDLRRAYVQKDSLALMSWEKEVETWERDMAQKRQELSLLMDQRAALVRQVELAEKVVQSSSVKILSPMAGTFSSSVGELDEKSTRDFLAQKDAAELMVLISELKSQKVMGPIKGTKVEKGDVLGKVVSPQNVQFFMPVKTEERSDMKEGSSVILSLDDGTRMDAVINSVSDGKPKGYSVIVGSVDYLKSSEIQKVAHVYIITEEHSGAIVDARSILEKDGRPGVLSVEKTYAVFKPVQILMTRGNQVVVKGLKDSDQIVLKPFAFLEGRRVR